MSKLRWQQSSGATLFSNTVASVCSGKECARRKFHGHAHTHDALVAMVSSATKKSRRPGTATAAHGLRKTRGSRGGLLAGALYSMPAEASSAVVGEKIEYAVARASRNGSPVSGYKNLTYNSLVTR